MAKKATGIMKAMPLSNVLAEFMGKSTASRGSIMKALWVYIKENDLQDSVNRRVIIPDGVLAPLIGSKKIDMFKMASAISKHIG